MSERPTIHSPTPYDLVQMIHALTEVIVSAADNVDHLVQAIREAHKFRAGGQR